jgi:N utilization substance protein B
MISRRNIRIKTLQSLYAFYNSSENLSVIEAKKITNSNFDQTLQLALANFLLAKQICEYCIIDANQKSSKHLPTEADLNISVKASQNSVVLQLLENSSFNKAVENAKLTGRWSTTNIVKATYNTLIETDEYKAYTASTTKTDADDITFFKYVLHIIRTNEDVEHLLEDIFINFEEDTVIVDEWVLGNVEQVKNIDFENLLPKDKREFGIELVETFIEKNEVTTQLIEPKLINWDVDRIAQMDRIIMQMGITELLYFPNIPTKVSINEYIDLAKEYSTRQSGQFVNGVMDKIHKELVRDNKISKIDRPNKYK